MEADKWIKKKWYVYIVEYYSAIKWNEIMPFAATWMNLEIIMQSEVSQGLPQWLSGKESACQCRRHRRCGFDPWVRISPEGGNGNPLQYSCLKNPLDRGAWCATVQGVAKSQK